MIHQYGFIRNALVIGVIVLLLGVSILPIINAEVSINKAEFVEISTELFGFENPASYTIQLSKEDSDKIDKIFEEIDAKLDSSETIDETIEIYDWAILELDKYRLFGDTSIEEVRKIVLGPYYNKIKAERMDKILSKYNKIFDDSTNSNCLINGIVLCNPGGYLNYCPMGIFPTLISTFITIFNYRIAPEFPIFIGIFTLILLYTLWIGAMFLPFLPFCVIGIGGYIDFFGENAAYGWINSQGMKGKINSSGPFFGQFPLYQMTSNFEGSKDCYYPGIFGFTGIQIFDFNNIGEGAKILGYALDVRLGPNRPSGIPW